MNETIKHLSVPFLPVGPNTTLHDLSLQLDVVQRNSIATMPWPAYNYKPEVFFAIGYSTGDICLKFYVSEKFPKAVYAHPNEAVYKDSCVEFFISFEEEAYYNFEFNCAGVCLLGFGKERAGRQLLPEQTVRSIRAQSLLRPATSRDTNISWHLTVQIPFEVFRYHSIKTLKGKKCRANFFKCGDEQAEPCFLVWNNIQTEHPDFHTPQYFGSMEFC